MNAPSSTGGGLLAGRVALVTGGASGIGLGMATAMARHGAAVVLACRRTETGEPAAEALRAEGLDAACVRCDVTESDDVRDAVAATLERHGRLDCLVHNAVAGQTGGPLVDAPGRGWRMLVASSLRASFDCARAGHAALRGTGGSLVLLTSAAGMEGSASMPLYGVVKAAQRGLAKGLAAEWGPDGIRVNCVAPSFATHPFLARTSSEELLAELASRAAFGRGAEPWEVANVVVFLASDYSSYLTGEVVSVSSQRA